MTTRQQSPALVHELSIVHRIKIFPHFTIVMQPRTRPIFAFLSPTSLIIPNVTTLRNAPSVKKQPARFTTRMLSTPTRREVLESAVLFSLGVLFPGAAQSRTKPTLESELVPVVMCRTVLNPVRRYVATGEWDKARTNVNYCTRVLGLKKRIRGAGDFLEGDAYFDALGIAADLDISLTELDSTCYTNLFVPGSDDDEFGLSVEQRKYQRAALRYYDTASEQLDKFLASIPGDALESARAEARKQKYEIRVEE